MWFHASPINNLHEIGLIPGKKPTVTKRATPWTYLGSLNYIKSQYLKYAPKGKYYIYEVFDDIVIDDTKLAGEQIRTCKPIQNLKLIGEIFNV